MDGVVVRSFGLVAATFWSHTEWIGLLRYLITGGAGFIGSVILPRSCSRAASSVHVLDDLSTGAIDNIRHLKQRSAKFHYTIESAANAVLVAELVDEADVVYHLAAAVGVELIVESPVRTIETNVACTEVVLATANKKRSRSSSPRRARSTARATSSPSARTATCC